MCATDANKVQGMKRCTTYAVQHYSVGPPLTHLRNAIKMAFGWRADGGPLLDVFWEKFWHPTKMFVVSLVIF